MVCFPLVQFNINNGTWHIFIVWACILSQAILFQYVGKMWIATSIPLLILSHILLLLKTSPSVHLFLSSKEISYPFESSAILFSSFQGGGMLRWCFPLFFFFSTVLCYCNSIFCLLKCIADSYSLCYGRPTVSCLYMRTLFKFGNIFGMPIAHYLKIYIHQALYIHQAWTILTLFEYEERLLPAYRIFALHLKRKLGEGSENLFGFAEINCK